MRRWHSMTPQVCCWWGNSIACHALFLTIKFPTFRKKPYSFLLTVPQLGKLHVPDDIHTTDIRNNQNLYFFFLERLPRTLKYRMIWHHLNLDLGLLRCNALGKSCGWMRVLQMSLQQNWTGDGCSVRVRLQYFWAKLDGVTCRKT